MLAGCKDVSVMERIVVAVSVARAKVDVRYIVLASWIDVSMRVSVSWGSVDTTVLY